MAEIDPEGGSFLRVEAPEAAGRDGSPEEIGRAMEACRQYLLLVANQEMESDLQAKGGASDLVQETFLEAQRDLDRFRGHSPTELRGWLRRILLNNLANFTRRYRGTELRRVDREVSLDATSTGVGLRGRLAGQGPSPSGVAIQREQAQALRAALGRLPEHYRSAVIWRHHEQLSFEQIGDRLGCSPDAARKVWVRAIERLQQEVEALPDPRPATP